METTTTAPTLATVTRAIVREPSNSKCPGGTRHVSITGADGRLLKFEAGALRGTGLASATLPAGNATIKMGGSFSRASGRMDRVAVEIPVIVTGDESDSVTGIVDGGSQKIEIRFTGARHA